MKKIIITGGCGFIGSNLVRYMLKKKFFVINIDKLTYSGNHYNLRNINSKNYIFYKGDFGDKKKLKKIINKYKPEAIFNVAAETHVDRSIDSPETFIKSNIISVFNLLEVIRSFSKKRKIKLIHISTDEVYGDIKSMRSDEKYPYQPSSPYSASKASADHLIKSYVRTYNLPAIISNCSNNYGNNQFPEKLIPKMIFNILNNKTLPIYAKGKNSREWIHVYDHCRALYCLFKNGKNGNSYNVGSGENLSNIQLVKKLIKVFRQKSIKIGKNVKIKFVKDRPGHDFRYALDSKKISKEMSWKPKLSLEKGLSMTIDWYLKNPNFFKRISKNFNYKRLGLKL